MKNRRIMALVLLITVLGALPANAQVSEAKKLDSDVPRLSNDQIPGGLIPWAIISVAVVGVLVLAFKNAKRNSMD